MEEKKKKKEFLLCGGKPQTKEQQVGKSAVKLKTHRIRKSKTEISRIEPTLISLSILWGPKKENETHCFWDVIEILNGIRVDGFITFFFLFTYAPPPLKNKTKKREVLGKLVSLCCFVVFLLVFWGNRLFIEKGSIPGALFFFSFVGVGLFSDPTPVLLALDHHGDRSVWFGIPASTLANRKGQDSLWLLAV